MADNLDPSTRELLAEAEKLRAAKKVKVPPTRQLVAQSEKLIGRETSGGKSATRMLLAIAALIAIAGICGYLFWSRV
jgi:hypothetical protein